MIARVQLQRGPDDAETVDTLTAELDLTSDELAETGGLGVVLAGVGTEVLRLELERTRTTAPPDPRGVTG